MRERVRARYRNHDAGAHRRRRVRRTAPARDEAPLHPTRRDATVTIVVERRAGSAHRMRRAGRDAGHSSPVCPVPRAGSDGIVDIADSRTPVIATQHAARRRPSCIRRPSAAHSSHIDAVRRPEPAVRRKPPRVCPIASILTDRQAR
ncbi:hypothetical protein C7S16_4268 [Burkholderia thailandensis]|uniref:Uncharacterized protein n=1 Tax=Burkholderia thailandensis TaxID=57975 RepID=A0AAW9CK35_BURTH|nr:hypothetical protein [Burkholderia thailandensis]MDW9251350.1 hypothetical protein [Burkholderia thailandensis]